MALSSLHDSAAAIVRSGCSVITKKFNNQVGERSFLCKWQWKWVSAAQVLFDAQNSVWYKIRCWSKQVPCDRAELVWVCRLTHLRKLGLVPKAASQDRTQSKSMMYRAGLEPVSGLDLEHSEAASSGLGPLPPWPTPLQSRQTLADWGRAQATENAQILAQR